MPLSGFVGELEQSLNADALHPKKVRRMARTLFVQIKASGYTRIADYIRARRASAGKDVKAFAPLRWMEPHPH